MEEQLKAIENLKIEVIATYENPNQPNEHIPQEIFQMKVIEDVLKSEKKIIEWVRLFIDQPRENLVKLSLCFICPEEILEKYKTIRDIVFTKNGKFYFDRGTLNG
jgi:hypothetical protein|tara:strand:+ start:415 stop:729 length:315 start_codon:yes stop_codon:yes gene_type:complete